MNYSVWAYRLDQTDELVLDIANEDVEVLGAMILIKELSEEQSNTLVRRLLWIPGAHLLEPLPRARGIRIPDKELRQLLVNKEQQ
tara:strand:+ start:302 stop:556 length:255 start_codon:yes stop_codon:yes gene_type:complete